jgi:hypothetical protein
VTPVRKGNKYAHLGLASGDNSVTRDEFGKDTTGGLDTKGKGSNINKDNVLSALLPRENTTLNRGTICDSLIRVNTLRRLPATKELLEKLLDLGNTSRATNEYDLIE